ncbi:MAG: hypothetical protein KME15_24410 [Drouetiella hepatica Uher 2000/2452]|jgi:hypothetical protein|uniref:Mobilization protein MobC n=1 Tax=Drouetiella hepatica Uher 2000/2452 TaxID=904376 RepID=A0A951URP1_9CYAN|nr:hypothetical protein [Drouetiella hepatica Uher 2000/2452]
MATATLKRARAGNVSKTALDQVGSLLQDLPEKSQDQISLRDAVAQLQGVIKDTLAKGYSYEDVAALLAQQEIAISPSTLRNYVLTNGSRTTQKQASTKTRAKRGAKVPSTEPIAAVIEPELETEQPEAIGSTKASAEAQSAKGQRQSSPATAQPETETEKKPRRGRASKAASTQPTAGSSQRSSAARGRKAAKA